MGFSLMTWMVWGTRMGRGTSICAMGVPNDGGMTRAKKDRVLTMAHVGKYRANYNLVG
jgi:hypothetical protein